MQKMNKKPKEICIGERIKEIFDQKNISITQFAKRLLCDRANVYNIFRRKKIDIHLLLRISEILDHDFVKEICAEREFFKDTPPSKISFVLEINPTDPETLKIFLKAIKQLDIKTICEVRS